MVLASLYSAVFGGAELPLKEIGALHILHNAHSNFTVDPRQEVQSPACTISSMPLASAESISSILQPHDSDALHFVRPCICLSAIIHICALISLSLASTLTDQPVDYATIPH